MRIRSARDDVEIAPDKGLVVYLERHGRGAIGCAIWQGRCEKSAGARHMWVIIHFCRAMDRRKRYARIFESSDKVIKRAAAYSLCDNRYRPVAGIDLVHTGLKGRIGQKLLKSQYVAKGYPLPLGHGPDEYLTALGGLENIRKCTVIWRALLLMVFQKIIRKNSFEFNLNWVL